MPEKYDKSRRDKSRVQRRNYQRIQKIRLDSEIESPHNN